MNRVSVIGLGYIGLPTAATLANQNIEVVGVDISEGIVNALNEGTALFFEPDLDQILKSTVEAGNLRAVFKPEKADAFIIAVPTPFLDDHKADLAYVERATRSIAKVLEKGNLVVLESTSPIGTTQKICDWISEERPDLKLPTVSDGDADIYVAYCPERILPGRMMYELVTNDRIIGGMTADCAKRAEELYAIFVKGEMHRTSANSAELVKLMENAYRDVNIAFANEVSMFCDSHNIDVWEAISLANKHPRVDILSPGPGVGGHCIAVDPWFLISASPNITPLMRTAREVNTAKQHFILDKVSKTVSKHKNAKVACLGLAYKPDVDDLRESPALEITKSLTQLLGSQVAEVLVVEPNIKDLPRELSDIEGCYLTDLDTAIRTSDILVVLVAHKPFMAIKGKELTGQSVIDAVGLLRS